MTTSAGDTGATFGCMRPEQRVNADCPPELMNAEDPAVHPLHVRFDGQAEGRSAHHRRLSRLRLYDASICLPADHHEGDIYWCTADVGWVTGHSYILYGPLANGATTLVSRAFPTIRR